MAHRKLREKIDEFHEFTGHRLSDVLREMADFMEKNQDDFCSQNLKHEWFEDDGHTFYVFLGR